MAQEAGHHKEPPLESWKEIAAYLKRDVRTVIRWEKSEGLPVRRQKHRVRSSVFAYASEIESWKARRQLPAGVPPLVAPRQARAAAGFALAVLLALGTTGGGAVLARVVPGEGGRGIVLRQLEFRGLDETPFAQLSPDGKRILCVRAGKGGGSSVLFVLDLPSGREEALIDGWAPGAEGSLFRWSPDGTQVVYTHQGHQLRVVDSQGGEPRLLWSSSEPTAIVKPQGWARDGRSILAAVVDDAARTVRLVLVPVEGGHPLAVVASGTRSELEEWASLSPDGRFVAGLRREGGGRRVWVWSSDGEQSAAVTEPEADSEQALWSPEGQHLVFLSDRLWTRDLWAVPMRDGRARGAPYRVKQGLGRNAALTGFTAAGQLTMVVTGEGTPPDVFVLEVDRSTGKARGELTAYGRYPTDHFLPRWSPDGQRIAYTSRKGQIRLPGLFIVSPDGRSEEEVPADGYFAGNVEWSPDGTELLFAGFVPPDGRAGIFRLSLESRRVVPLHLGERLGPGHEGAFVHLQWLPLAERFVFEKLAGAARLEVYTMDRRGRQVERVAEVPTTFWSWPAPDGRHIAYREGRELKLLTIADQTSVTLATSPEATAPGGPAWSPDARAIAFSDARRLLVLSPVEGAPSVLAEAPPGWAIGGTAWASGLAWAPDARAIAYLQRETPAGSGARTEVWVVSPAGGAARRLAVAPPSHPLLSDLGWHSSGRMILATGNPAEHRRYEHWVMEDFLPAR
jgi:Tol biopolymer transport system component